MNNESNDEEDYQDLFEDHSDSSEDQEEPIDYSDWTQASLAEVRDYYVTSRQLEEVIVPMNVKKKKFWKLYIRELPITEQLDLLERFFIIDSKTGDGKLKWRQYYAALYSRMVKKTVPPIPWKEARMYNKKFMAVLNNYLPSPFDITGDNVTGLPEKETKN